MPPTMRDLLPPNLVPGKLAVSRPRVPSYRSLVLGCTLLLSQILAAPSPGNPLYEPPSNYYDTATGTGATLKSQLHDIIEGHTVFTYSGNAGNDTRTILQDTDADPNNPGNVLLVYDRTSLDVSSIGTTIDGWDFGDSWNREHSWPRSLGVGNSGADNTDLHHLRASDPSINQSRGNLDFGGAFGQPFGSVQDGGTKWYPGDADAGMIARQQFYMAVRYDGSDSSTVDLELAASGSSSGTLGNLNRMIEWHYEAVPDDFELRRNDVIYDDYQGNRNPFIDHPEFVWSVFVDQQNDSQLTIAGGTSTGSGGSVLDIDLGRHYVGETAIPSASATVQKSGNDGTYFRVSGTGIAPESAVGRYAMSTGGSDSFTLPLNDPIDTSSAGMKTGVLIVDNLDITSGFGTGHGDLDANDLINLSAEVVSHPVASLASDQVLGSLTIDLGEIPLGFTGALDTVAGIHNYDGTGAPAFAALLDLDAIGSGTGDTDVFGLGLSTFSDLEQGESVGIDAVLDATQAGIFSATFDLDLSGEDLPGELTQSLSVTLTAEVSTDFLLGDFNQDGLVDAADYAVWRDTEGQSGLAPFAAADANGDGTVDTSDRDLWASNYGVSVPLSVAVPEPGTLACLMLLGTSQLLVGRRGSRREFA